MQRLLTLSAKQLKLELDIIKSVIITTSCLGGERPGVGGSQIKTQLNTS